MSSYDRSLLQIFTTEQADHIRRMRAALDELLGRTEGDRAPLFEELLRRAHTLKGAARSVGLEPTELLVHRMEDKLVQLQRSGAVLEPEAYRGFKTALDAAEDILAAALAATPLPDVAHALQAMEEDAAIPVPAGIAVGRSSGVPLNEPMDFVRVRASSLDELIRASSELLMSVTGNPDADRARAHAARLGAIEREWTRLRKRAEPYLQKTKADPEGSAAAQCFYYIDAQLNGLRREANSTAEEIHATARQLQLQAQTLSHNAAQIRMTPAETVFGGFGAMVRDLAQQEGKRVEFSAEGLDVEADRLVLQALKDPVMHLLRNAVSHGIEPESDRLARSKPASGSIRLRIAVQGDRLKIDVQDDGRGLNRQGIADEARRRGLTEALEAEAEGPRLSEVIFQPGFSTAGAVTGISGRGMGLPAAREAVRKLHGEIGIQPAPRAGVVASLSTPLSIASQHVLLVRAGGQKFGLATAHLEKLYRISAAELKTVQGRENAVLDGRAVPLYDLNSLLGSPASGRASDPWLDICLVVAEGQRMALAVDEFIEQQDSIIKESGLPASIAGATSGAIPLEDGTVAVMLDVAALVERAKTEPAELLPAARPAAAQATKILVVDDSITSRSLERTILEANGYRVQLAVDGLEALERLRTDLPDLVITDVAMPRLNGFQLLERMKNDEALKNIPVILITSLESREDQERGLSLGADAYIVKRKFDQRELLSVIRQIL